MRHDHTLTLRKRGKDSLEHNGITVTMSNLLGAS
jgi:hypothetical protein